MGLNDAFKFSFGPDTMGVRHAENITAESTRCLEELLEENHRSHHIFSVTENEKGVYFHNHMAHHDITVWAMGGTPRDLRNHHFRNALYQREPVAIQKALVIDLALPRIFNSCLGREENYNNFVKYFQNEISSKGYEHVLQKYLFNGSPMANDLLIRSYMGYVHGIIHIGLSIEFKQAKLLAEGLAQAAVHHDWWYTEYLEGAEKLAKQAKEPALPLSDCIDLAYADEKVRHSCDISFHGQVRPISGEPCVDKEAARDGVLVNAREEILQIAARYRVDPNNVEKAAAELQNAAVYLTCGAQHPPHTCAIDFSLLHTVTASTAITAFLKEPSLTREQKAKLIEYNGRCAILTYACQGAPKMVWSWVMTHPSRLPDQDWDALFERATRHEDDGHMCKLVRGIANAQETSKPYNHLPEFRVKQDMFLIAGTAVMDSGSIKPMEITKHFDFLRGAGFDEAWEQVKLRNKIAALPN